MKTKMNKTNKKSIKSRFINNIALTLVLSMTVFMSCQKEVGIVPNTSPVANSGLIKSNENRENSGLSFRLSGEEMHGAKSTTTDDCKSFMAEFKAKIKLIESLRCSTDAKSRSKLDNAVAEANQLIGDMQSAGCKNTLLPGGVAKLEQMINNAAGCDEEVEDKDDFSSNG